MRRLLADSCWDEALASQSKRAMNPEQVAPLDVHLQFSSFPPLPLATCGAPKMPCCLLGPPPSFAVLRLSWGPGSTKKERTSHPGALSPPPPIPASCNSSTHTDGRRKKHTFPPILRFLILLPLRTADWGPFVTLTNLTVLDNLALKNLSRPLRCQ